MSRSLLTSILVVCLLVVTTPAASAHHEGEVCPAQGGINVDNLLRLISGEWSLVEDEGSGKDANGDGKVCVARRAGGRSDENPLVIVDNNFAAIHN